MAHITQISVKNFRAIRELEYSPKQINVITGRNNTGKSALLDAIAINVPGNVRKELDSYLIDRPLDFITIGEKFSEITSNLNSITIYSNITTLELKNKELINEIFDELLNFLKNAFENKDYKNIINDEDFENEYFGLFNKYIDLMTFYSDYELISSPYFKNQTLIGEQYFEGLRKFNESIVKLIKKYTKTEINIKGKRSRIASFRETLLPEKISVIEKPMEEITNVVRISHYDKLSFEDASEEEIIVLEEFIKQHDIIKNFKRLSQKGITYYKDEKLNTIPISVHGDGLIALLNISRFLLKAKDGILLIEEPENHLHPQFIDIFIENLYFFCQKLNVQVFMTTHNFDLIQSALKYPQSESEKNMLLISKLTSDGDIIEKFDYNLDEGLKVINELYLDLRGS